MMLLTVDEIIGVHSQLIIKTGGLDGLRDRALLESAVASATNSFEGIEQYPTIEEKAARLAFAITSNHAFIDGNKRIGVLVMLMTLRLNKRNIFYTQQELVDFGISLATSECKYSCVYEWLMAHSE